MLPKRRHITIEGSGNITFRSAEHGVDHHALLVHGIMGHILAFAAQLHQEIAQRRLPQLQPARYVGVAKVRVENLQHVLWAEGLQQIAVHLQLNGFLHVGKIIIAADDDKHRLQTIQLSHVFNNVQPAHAAHLNINQHDIRLLRRDGFIGGKSVVHRGDHFHAAAFPVNEGDHIVARVDFIICNQNPKHLRYLLLDLCSRCGSERRW